ncbi:MAG: protein-L-isoaspartate(D-aspartate) O-methyltransferase [Acidobacteria bacterium]|nr:protein-L-isoaspartate(D-aspartate) O-methyltransferase [Acidobacteriota bacterium]
MSPELSHRRAERPPRATVDRGAYERRCQRMVRQQILGRGIESPRILEAFLSTPRHCFVDEALSERAYGDGPLPIGCGQTLSGPYIVARMISLLAPERSDRVLEIGTGSGYQAALLDKLAGSVYTLERLEPLAKRAQENWKRAGCDPIALRVADGSLGWPTEAPFTAILVSAATPSVPRALLRQLVPGGRMVIPVGDVARQILKRLVRTDTGAQVEEFDACSFVRLVGQQGFDE